MFANLVWLFPAYREAVASIARLERVIEDLERTKTPTATVDELSQLANHLFAEEAFPQGAIPDNAWLTPGEDLRAERQ